jgi:hypothetical protein
MTKGRVQLGLNNLEQLHAFRYRTRFRLEGAFDQISDHPSPVTWLTLAEFWNDNSNTAFPFRVTLNVNKDAGVGEPLFFHGHGQSKGPDGTWSNTFWELESHVTAPVNEWMLLDILLIEGEDADGYVGINVTTGLGSVAEETHVVADLTGRTKHPSSPPDGFNTINLFKLYTSGALLDSMALGTRLQASWDDFRLETCAPRAGSPAPPNYPPGGCGFACGNQPGEGQSSKTWVYAAVGVPVAASLVLVLRWLWSGCGSKKVDMNRSVELVDAERA